MPYQHRIGRLVGSVAYACFLTMLLVAPINLAAQSQPVPKAPNGWTKTRVSGKRANTCFTFDGLKSPDYLVVKYYDRERLVDGTLESWLLKRLNGNAPLGGKWTGPSKNVTRQTANFYTAERDFKLKGVEHSLIATAVCVDKLNIRLAATIHSKTDTYRKNESIAKRLCFQLLKLEVDAAKSSKRGLDLEINPPKLKGLKAGGTIKPGLYIGSSVSRRDNKTERRYEVVIHANGEYEFLNQKRKNVGRITYSNATGKLEIDEPFENDSRDWDTEFCIYGKDPKKNAVIHAQTKYRLTRLVWARESDRSSPSEFERAKEIAKAEANRYQHVTEPGKGVDANEIAAVIYFWDTEFRSGALQIDHEGYLLMKDGRVLDGLPCPPDMVDVPASRSRAPDSWGWWRKAKDDEEKRYEFSWPFKPQQFRMPKGSQVVGVPLKAGTRLEGDFGAASTKSNLATNYSSVRWWGIKFDKNGRFLKYRRGSTQTGGVPGMETIFTNVWNDEGSVTSLSGPEAVGGSKTKFNNPVLDRMGRYRFDGYRLTLKFDSGREEQLASFTNKDESAIWFEGRMLHKRKKKN